jgi:hypothetical protein
MDWALPGCLFVRTRRKPRREKRPGRQAVDEAKKEKRLFCARCRHLVTHRDACIRVNGAHEHTCANPAGLVFHIGCFGEAGGCAALGVATLEYTWFAGYAWQVAVCARCGLQLGWRYRGPADGFFGLILDRLTSAAGDGT